MKIIQNEIFIIILVLLLFNPSNSAMLETNLKEISDKIIYKIEKLNRSKKFQPNHIVFLPYCRESHILTLQPIFDSLKKIIKRKSADFKFHNIGSIYYPYINAMIITESSNILSSSRVKKFTGIKSSNIYFISGAFSIIDSLSNNKINFKIKLSTIRGEKLFESISYVINPVSNDLKCKLMQEKSLTEVIKSAHNYIRISLELSKFFKKHGSAILQYPAKYSFTYDHYADGIDVENVKTLLKMNYGIQLISNSQNKITIEHDGKISFENFENGKKIIHQTGNIVHTYDVDWGDDNIQGDDSSVYYTENDSVFSRAFIQSDSVIYKEIKNFMENNYPGLFNPFQYDILNALFYKTDYRSILVGKVIDREKEIVQYKWRKKENWLKDLNRLYENEGRRYFLNTRVLRMYEDPDFEGRYWAIVYQDWQTAIVGRLKPGYQDDGFLIMYFDFNLDNELTVNIYLRLWFNNYKKTTQDGLLTPILKLRRDINKYFINQKMKGINNTIKKNMAEAIIKCKRQSMNNKLIIKE